MKLNRILMLFFCFILFIGASGCGSTKLADGFVEKDVHLAAENIISLINQGDAEGILKISSAQLQSALSEKVMTQIFADIHTAGNFVKIEDMSIAGIKSKDLKEDFAVVIAKAKYENKSLIYTISFNKAMELIGLYYK